MRVQVVFVEIARLEVKDNFMTEMDQGDSGSIAEDGGNAEDTRVHVCGETLYAKERFLLGIASTHVAFLCRS